jgi:SAM-dependent methyltransferase
MKSTVSLFDAALESASIFNRAVSECAESSGLIAYLRQPRTADEIVRDFRFHPERRSLLEALLATLESEAVIARLVDREGRNAFAAGSAPAGRHAPRRATSEWFGEAHAELVRSSNKEFLGEDLGLFRSLEGAIKFNREFESAWRTNLQNPLYEFGRLRCVAELVSRGCSFLDLACGPGFGIQRLAEFSTEPCTIVGVDKSRDFLEIASRIVYPAAKFTLIHRDLNRGLPPFPPGSFDGILFNGAFHFISDKPARLAEMHFVLRPGGLLAIGHCFSRSGFADEAMHDFYFSLLEDASWPVGWSSLKDDVAQAGFGVVEEFHRGSHSYLLAERLQDSPPAPDPR